MLLFALVELYFPGIIFHKLKQDPVPDDGKMDDAENIPVTQKEEAMTDLGQLCMRCEVSDRVMCPWWINQIVRYTITLTSNDSELRKTKT